MRARRHAGAVGDGGDLPAAPQQRARLGDSRWPNHRPATARCQIPDDRRETAQRRGCKAPSGVATPVARFGIPEHRARHEGRLRETLKMTQLLWLSIPAIALTMWAYRQRPRRANDLGSVSAQWLHEHLNGTHNNR